MDTLERFPMEPIDPAWEAANPDWRDVPPDDIRWRPKPGDKSGNLAPQSTSKPLLHIVNPTDLVHTPVPVREWIVEDWLPVGCVTACYGDGGVGKTLLAHQLMTSTAIGALWCGRDVLRCRSFGLFCEDDEEELHRRQVAICEAYGVSLSDLEPMRWVSGVGNDNALLTFDQDRSAATPLYEAIREAALQHGARLVVLDTAADLFAGNENDRHQVRRFIGQLNRLAIDIGGAVLLNAHPSRTGLSTGNLDGGSTAWSNSVRSRWSLARPPEEDDNPPDLDARILTRRKANYASVGDTVQLRWKAGVLVTEAAAAAPGPGHAAAVEATFLRLLDRHTAEDRRMSDSKNAGNYAPRVFAKAPDRCGFTRKDFEHAMAVLFAERRIRMAPYGRVGDARQQIVRAGGNGGAP